VQDFPTENKPRTNPPLSPGGKTVERGVEDPPCSRCHKKKEVRKHHFPLGSRRMAFLCNHCYDVVRRQRQRGKTFGYF
jgi:hypothetical protein